MRPRIYVEGAATRLEGPLLFLRRTLDVGLNDAVEIETDYGPPRLGRVAALDEEDRKSTRLNSSHIQKSRMPSSA